MGNVSGGGFPLIWGPLRLVEARSKAFFIGRNAGRRDVPPLARGKGKVGKGLQSTQASNHSGKEWNSKELH